MNQLFGIRVVVVAALGLGSLGLKAAERPVPVLSPACALLLEQVPDADLLYDFVAKRASEVHKQLHVLNLAFSPERRFSEEQISELFSRFMHADIEDQMQLRNMFALPENEGRNFVDAATGHLGEWEQPIHDYLLTILQRPMPTREDVQARRNQHSRYNPILNPIMVHRRKSLAARLEQVNKKLGQRVMSDEELDHATRETYLAEGFLKILAVYEQLEQSPNFSILKVKQLLYDINKSLHTSDGFGGHDIITAAICRQNDPALIEELEYYRERGRAGKISSEDGELISARIKGFVHGEFAFQDSIKQFLLAKLHRALENGLSDNPYVGYGAPLYSVLRTVNAEKHFDGVEKVKEDMASLRWSEARLSYFGSWNRQAMQKILGVVMDPKPIRYKEHVFGVELPLHQGARHFALLVKANVEGDIPLDLANYRQLHGLEVKEIRSTLVAARLQDGFSTDPVDWREPLVVLADESGQSSFKNTPNQLIIQRVKKSSSETESAPWNDLEKLHVTAQTIASAFNGAPRGEYATIRLFRDQHEALAQELNLPLVAEPTGQQIYSLTLKAGWLREVSVTLTRHLVTQTYTLETATYVGAATFRLPLKRWTGIFKVPQ